MRTASKQKFLIVGLAGSLALHLVLGPFVRAERTVAAQEPPPGPLRVERLFPTPPPSPRPTPTPVPPRASPPPHARLLPPRHPVGIVIPRTTARTGSGPRADPNRAAPDGRRDDAPQAAESAVPSSAVTPLGAPTPIAVPVPQPSATPLSCARPNLPAATLHAAAVDTPALAAQQGVSGEVEVVVSLDAASRVIATQVRSSPSLLLNAAAVAAARGSRFRTELRGCLPVAADYLFTVEFAAE